MNTSTRSTAKALTVAALFMLSSSSALATELTENDVQVPADLQVVDLLDEPDTTVLQHINQQYLFSCESPEVWEERFR